VILKQGEPFGGLSIYAQYKVFKFAKKKGLKVMLGGQGADELLAGYSGYPGHRLLSIFEVEGFWAAHKFAKFWSKHPGRNYILAWKYFFKIKLQDFIYKLLRTMLGRSFEPNWLNIKYLKNYGVICAERREILTDVNKGLRVKERAVYSFTHRGLSSLLRHEDRNSMSFSIENRVPFLTIKLAEFLLSLPEKFLISEEGVTKNIFRESMRGILPESHINRKDKIGFEAPDANLIISNSEYFKSLINDSPDIPFINKAVILKEFKQFLNRKRVFDHRFWRWINYLRWYQLIVNNKNS
jgi:asparagine synthase (glutamine-hydrolysing)